MSISKGTEPAVIATLICVGTLAGVWVLALWRPPLPLAEFASVPLVGSFTPQPVDASVPAPQFTGELAAEYTMAWENSQSDALRAALADEQITGDEQTAISEALKTCLAEQGITLLGYSAGGGFSTESPAMSAENFSVRLDFCTHVTGDRYLNVLYQVPTQYPNAITTDALIARCLVRNDAVVGDYTEEQLVADRRVQAIPLRDDAGRKTLDLCERDVHYEK